MKKIMIAGVNAPGNRYGEIKETLKNLGADSFISLDIEDMDKADGLIFPGSFQDMNPALWGEENTCSNDINDQLDEVQLAMMKKAEEEKKPVLGICRGMQLINVYFGGTLIQDLSCSAAHCKENPEKYHRIYTVSHTFMEELFGDETSVNTRHHQGIGIIGKALLEAAFWSNGEERVPEAIVHKELPVTGVQWHPETMYADGKDMIKEDGGRIFKYFLNSLG